MSERQTGRTTKQMLDAPIDAIYVWVNSQTYYPQMLARSVGRDDLRVVSPDRLDNTEYTHHYRNHPIVIDHACDLTRQQRSVLARIETSRHAIIIRAEDAA